MRVPISLEKTEWASTRMIFLGILLDGEYKVLVVPEEKRIKALNLLESLIQKNKAKVRELQQLAGTLNFLSCAIYPGRAFIRSMYDKFTGFVNLMGNK